MSITNPSIYFVDKILWIKHNWKEFRKHETHFLFASFGNEESRQMKSTTNANL